MHASLKTGTFKSGGRNKSAKKCRQKTTWLEGSPPSFVVRKSLRCCLQCGIGTFPLKRAQNSRQLASALYSAIVSTAHFPRVRILLLRPRTVWGKRDAGKFAYPTCELGRNASSIN